MLLRLAVAGALAVALAVIVSPAFAAPSKPHIVLGVLDDAGDFGTIENMPDVSQWLGRGTRFTNSFVDFSLCGPSRTTELTGLTAHNHGVLCNEPPAAGWASITGRSWI